MYACVDICLQSVMPHEPAKKKYARKSFDKVHFQTPPERRKGHKKVPHLIVFPAPGEKWRNARNLSYGKPHMASGGWMLR